jgi:hypothetical protein
MYAAPASGLQVISPKLICLGKLSIKSLQRNAGGIVLQSPLGSELITGEQYYDEQIETGPHGRCFQTQPSGPPNAPAQESQSGMQGQGKMGQGGGQGCGMGMMGQGGQGGGMMGQGGGMKGGAPLGQNAGNGGQMGC